MIDSLMLKCLLVLLTTKSLMTPPSILAVITLQNKHGANHMTSRNIIKSIIMKLVFCLGLKKIPKKQKKIFFKI